MFMNEKNTRQMSWLQTRVEILKFEWKKTHVELKKKMWVKLKKTELESRKRQHWPGVLSINVFTSSIQSRGSLAIKKMQLFSSPLLDLSRTRRGSLVSIIWKFTIPILAPLRGQKDTCNSVVKILWDSRVRLCRNKESTLSMVNLTGTQWFNHQ